MVRLLHIVLKPIASVDLHRFEIFVLVDTQPRSKNHSLPFSIQPSIVIDHHDPRKDTPPIEFLDIRARYGSTSTIVAEYLIQAGLLSGKKIATALYYGIRSDTLDLGRQATEADFKAAIALHPQTQLKIVSKIAHPELSREYVLDFDRALHEARIYGDIILADLGYLRNTDMVALMADFFLQFTNIHWSLVLARDGESLFFSLRTRRFKTNAGRIAQQLVKDRGAAGGHDQVAGGQIPLLGLPSEKIEDWSQVLAKKFLKMVGKEGALEERLLPIV
jgi:nanoRNase/pAp phosphatase (c-di-AMP/oligoRNAs hydrolase)